jgi:hypothetical protein
MHGLRDDAGTLGFARVQLSNRQGPWFYAGAAKLTVADASNLRYDFGVSEEAATRRLALFEEGQLTFPLSQVGPYRPGGGLRSVDATLSGGREVGERVRVFGYAQYGVVLGSAVDSPLVRTRGTYLVGVGVSVVVF